MKTEKKVEVKPKKDNINPNHYKAGKIEVIEIMKDQLSAEQFKGFCKGLIMKYLVLN